MTGRHLPCRELAHGGIGALIALRARAQRPLAWPSLANRWARWCGAGIKAPAEDGTLVELHPTGGAPTTTRQVAQRRNSGEMMLWLMAAMSWLIGHPTQRRGPGAHFLCLVKPRRETEEGSHRLGGKRLGGEVGGSELLRWMEAHVLLLLRWCGNGGKWVWPLAQVGDEGGWRVGLADVERGRSLIDEWARPNFFLNSNIFSPRYNL
jgi:hypothetical protein